MIRSILMVEDALQSRLFLGELLADIFPKAAVHEATDMRSAVNLCERKQFDLALVDLQLPDGNGYTVLRKLGQTQESVVSIVTTAMASDSAIVAALSAGAQGYLLKSDPPEMILRHLRAIPDGAPTLSPAIARRVMDHFRATGPSVDDAAELTPRESEVLSLVARGLRVADVAAVLDLAPSTVSSHIKAIYRKLNINSRAEAAFQAARMGLLDQG